jgi:hypothetical protein
MIVVEILENLASKSIVGEPFEGGKFKRDGIGWFSRWSF